MSDMNAADTADDTKQTVTAEGILNMIRAQEGTDHQDDFWFKATELLLQACVSILTADGEHEVSYPEIASMLREDIGAIGAGKDSAIGLAAVKLGEAGREADAQYRAFRAFAAGETAISVEVATWQFVNSLCEQ